MRQSGKLSIGLIILVGLCSWLWARSASAQALAVQGNHFTVDGAARFLTFITYFDALDVPDDRLEVDLNNLKNAVHIDGIRVLPNWWAQTARVSGRTFARNTVMDEAGNLRGASWNRLVRVLDRARAYGLVVDVTWTADTVGPVGASGRGTLDYARYKQALGTVTSMLAGPGYNHVLFDLQNESSNIGPLGSPLSDGQVADLTGYVHAIDPGRIVTVSVDQQLSPGQARARADATGQNVVAWHEPRNRSWYQSAALDVPELRATGKPAYLQEPPKYEDDGASANDFLEAARRAKMAGAAAWCYHTAAGQWMNPGGGNPNGGIWDRITGAAPDVDPNHTDNGVIGNLSPRLDGVIWGIGSQPGVVTFYWDINFAGPSFSASNDIDFVGWDWNDQISSIHIPPGRTVILYQDWHFGGATLTLTGDIPDLRAYNWNDWASSIQIR
jgi:hypothetical protein